MNATPFDETRTGRPGFLKAAWRLAHPYWSSQERWSARGLLAVVIAMNLALVAIDVALNSWNASFFNALQEFDEPAFLPLIARFSALAAIYILVASAQYYLNQMLRIRWRRAMIERMLGDYLGGHAYYRLRIGEVRTDNPDQRLTQDINEFVDTALTLTVGLLKALVNLASFLVILWTLSGPITVPIAGGIRIDGYLVWVALAYAGVGTWATSRVGRRLIGLNFQQERYEADFRFALMRVRENAEGIAIQRGEAAERGLLAGRFSLIVGNFKDLVRRATGLTMLTEGYGQIAAVFPLAIVAPRYFAKQVELGVMTQTVGAFSQVQGSLSFIIDSYFDVASWRAVIDRLAGFEEAVALARAAPRRLATAPTRITFGDGSAISLDRACLLLPNGAPLRGPLSLRVERGEAVLLSAASGWGKSTLLRALAGIWPYVDGSIVAPPPEHALFLPQTPYLPLGSLRAALCYPSPATGMRDRADDARLIDALAACHLARLADALDAERDWTQILSPGEQQRLALARALLRAPHWLFLDEASAALDEDLEAELYRRLRSTLPDAALISVGHRSTLTLLHARRIDLGALTEPKQGADAA